MSLICSWKSWKVISYPRGIMLGHAENQFLPKPVIIPATVYHKSRIHSVLGVLRSLTFLRHILRTNFSNCVITLVLPLSAVHETLNFYFHSFLYGTAETERCENIPLPAEHFVHDFPEFYHKFLTIALPSYVKFCIWSYYRAIPRTNQHIVPPSYHIRL